jgi:DNA-binding CsgD family transcriptional regulator
LGLSFAHAWNWAVLFSPFVWQAFEGDAWLSLLSAPLPYLGAMILTILLAQRLLASRAIAVKAFVSAALALLAFACVSLGLLLGLAAVPGMSVALWFVAGVGISALFCLWEFMLSTYPAIDRVVPYTHLAITSLLGGLFLLIIGFIQADLQLPVLLSLPMLSAAMALAAHHIAAEPASANKRLAAPRSFGRASNEVFSWRVFIYIGGYSLALGYAAYHCHTAAIAFHPAFAYVGLAFILPSLAMMALAQRDRVADVSVSMLRFFMPVSVLLVSLTLLQGVLAPVCAILSIVVFSAYTQVTFGTAIEKTTFAGVIAEHAFLPSRLSGTFGVLLGWVLGAMSGIDATMLSVAVIAMVMLLILSGTLGLRKNLWVVQKESSEITEKTAPMLIRKSPDAGSYAATIKSIAQEHGLTDRQTEILSLLGKGRNARFIRTELFISEKTARTHIYNIYKKLGVHSQQDILGLIDKANRFEL